MSKSPWGKVGAWAAEAERAEAEEREAAEMAAAAIPEPSFPSLKEAAATTNTTKQKKKTKMSLQEFKLFGSQPSRGLTHEEMLLLPTGPKERSADEMHSGRIGGGFSNYGSNQGRPRGEYEGRRSYGFQEDERQQARVSEMDQPSRADGVDNWASMKKQMVPEYFSPQSRPGPGAKYSSLGGGGAASRADEVDNWATDKKPISQPQHQSRSSSFGSGFSRPDTDRWARNEQRLDLSSPKLDPEVVVKGNKPNPFGTARPREEVLAEKGLDWKKLDLEIEGKQQLSSGMGGSRPTSSQSSRPESPLSNKSGVTARVGEGSVKNKPKVNPFGDAKPREVLLQEKGLDWKKIDLELEHRRVEREETEEEKNLKEEIKLLKQELLQKSGDEQSSMNEVILQKEQELEVLVRQLDDKVRYSQKNFDRQGGSGFNGRPPSRSEDPRERPHSRSGMMYEDPLPRPPSQSGRASEDPHRFERRPGPSYEEPRDYNERPRSRGSVNSWTRPSYDRRDIQGGGGGGGGRGFFATRDSDRSGSRW